MVQTPSIKGPASSPLQCSFISAVPYRQGESLTHEVHLLNDLVDRNLNNRGKQLARPVRHVSHPLTVHFGLNLVQILDFDEKNQVITFNVWKQYTWYDYFHTWNASEYGGVRKVSLPCNLIWTPDIVLYDNIEKRDNENHGERLLLHSDGRVEWIPYVVYKSACAVDMFNFPFDTQKCSFKFGSWTYSGQEVDLVFKDNKNEFLLHQLLPNIEWVITNSSAERHEVTYECCPETYVDLTYTLVVTRQWGFFAKFMLLPAALLSCLVLVIFWIPPMRPDRTGLGMSSMGSFMLLLILVTGISPPSEEIMFVTYICFNMVAVAVATLISCVMVNLSLRTVPVPKYTKIVFLRILPTVLCMNCASVPDPATTSKEKVHDVESPETKRKIHRSKDNDIETKTKLLRKENDVGKNVGSPESKKKLLRKDNDIESPETKKRLRSKDHLRNTPERDHRDRDFKDHRNTLERDNWGRDTPDRGRRDTMESYRDRGRDTPDRAHRSREHIDHRDTMDRMDREHRGRDTPDRGRRTSTLDRETRGRDTPERGHRSRDFRDHSIRELRDRDRGPRERDRDSSIRDLRDREHRDRDHSIREHRDRDRDRETNREAREREHGSRDLSERENTPKERRSRERRKGPIPVKNTKSHKDEWNDVVMVLDRIMFFLFFIVVTLLAYFFFPRP